MSEAEKTKLDLMKELIVEKRKATLAHIQYLFTRNLLLYKEDSLHTNEARLLFLIAPGEGKKMSQLSNALRVSQGAVSQMARRLEFKGYITRARDKHNQRVVYARLSPKGETYYNDHMDYQLVRFDPDNIAVLDQYSEEELKIISRYEQHMAGLFSKMLLESKEFPLSNPED